MPRRGLTEQTVVAAARRIADADGLDAVTIAAVAADLGVRPPSLYNHVGSRGALLDALGAGALEELASAMATAAAGLAGDQALLAVAQAMRAHALAHPGAYAATTRVAADSDARLQAAGAAVMDVVWAVLRGYDLDGDDAVHAARAVRSLVHGFLTLEQAGGFAMAADADASFAWAVGALASGLPS